MDHLRIEPGMVEQLLDRRFVRLFDLHYAPGRHYYVATRRTAEDLTCLRSDEAYRAMTPDAVSCFVVLQLPGEAPKLLLNWEYRYPVGQFLLSVTAGLIDPADRDGDSPALTAAAREIHEETGLTVAPGDSLTVVNPAVFSTPGLTDESNALVAAVLHPADLSALSTDGAEGSELFDGFALFTQAEARDMLRCGRDPRGGYLPLYTWAALMWFTVFGAE